VIAGVCDPGCDPLTQALKVGTSTAACGSPTPDMPSKGCYGYDQFGCAPTGPSSWTLTDRTMPRTNAAGNPYLNGCAPGFIPLFFEQTGSTRTLCTGFCAALEIDSTAPHVGNVKGDATALGKLPTSPAAVAGDATCNANKKGSEASSSCRFLWPYLVDGSTGELPLAFDQSIHRDTLGVCMAIAYFLYDSDNDMIPDASYPDCATLPPRSATTMGTADDAADWGCQLRANSMMFATSGKPRALQDIRIGALETVQLAR
jgi:hypothetical protein